MVLLVFDMRNMSIKAAQTVVTADVAEMFPNAEIIKDICGIERVVVVRA